MKTMHWKKAVALVVLFEWITGIPIYAAENDPLEYMPTVGIQECYVKGLVENQAVAELYVPQQVTLEEETYQVTAIGKKAFYQNDILETVYLPEGLTSIRQEAFSYCINLKQIQLPSTLTRLTEKAFYHAEQLELDTIPEGVTVLPQNVFSNTGIQVFTIPKSVVYIDRSAFSSCKNLRKIIFLHETEWPTIMTGAFANTKQLTEIWVTETMRDAAETYFRERIENQSLQVCVLQSEEGNGNPQDSSEKENSNENENSNTEPDNQLKPKEDLPKDPSENQPVIEEEKEPDNTLQSEENQSEPDPILLWDDDDGDFCTTVALEEELFVEGGRKLAEIFWESKEFQNNLAELHELLKEKLQCIDEIIVWFPTVC